SPKPKRPAIFSAAFTSAIRVFFPLREAMSPKAEATLVLPTPPFPETIRRRRERISSKFMEVSINLRRVKVYTLLLESAKFFLQFRDLFTERADLGAEEGEVGDAAYRLEFFFEFFRKLVNALVGLGEKIFHETAAVFD